MSTSLSGSAGQAGGAAPLAPITTSPPAGVSAWSTGAPSSPPSASQTASPKSSAAPMAVDSPLHAADNTPSSRPAFAQSPYLAAATTTTTADAANVIYVPRVGEESTNSRDGPMSDSATHAPSPAVRSGSRLSKQSSSYLSAPSGYMAAWRGAADVEDNAGTPFDNDVFDPTEVPTLRHTLNITVMRDGKVVEEALDPYEVARLYGQQQAALRSLQSRYDFLAVPDWVRVHPLMGTYLAEFIGTFAWVLTLALVSVRNESIFTVADDTNITSIPIGFMFTSMIFTFGYVSSAHFNPAVSVAVFLVRQMDLTQCFAYILCQLAGSFLAGVVSMVIQGNTDVFIPSVSSSYITSGIFSELVFTFAICLVVLNIAYSRQSGNFFYGFAVGMTITAGSASVGRISGGAFNPAAATGLQVAMCIVSNCDDLKSVWIYWLAPLIGAVAAALLFSQMVQPQDTQVLDDNKVFQDVNQLQRQRMAAQTAALGEAAAAAAAAADHSSDSSRSSSNSSSSSSSARRSAASSSSSDSGDSQEMQYIPQTRTPRYANRLSREEVEEAEEEADRYVVGGPAAATAVVSTPPPVSVPVPVPAQAPPSAPPAAAAPTPAPTAAATAAAPEEISQRPVLANNSDLDNWRRLPPPRRDDAGAKPANNHIGDSSWF